MADKGRFFDVWIVETNTVYREVPFQVVADWVQQGRLLEDDRLRPSGTAEWFRVGASPEFTPYMPRPEPFRAEDQAEALEPVELDFRYRHRHQEEDDDVDMIPLIDVSLVLLIFFMLISTGVGAVFVPTSQADYGNVANNPDEIVLGVDLKGRAEDRKPVFLLWVGNTRPEPGDDSLSSQQEVLDRLKAYLKAHPGRFEVSINAHPDVKAGVVRRLTAALEEEERNPKSDIYRRIEKKFIGVSEKE
jgi:biopolymer transport protein ExbD